MLLQAIGSSVRSCLSEARRVAGFDLKASRELLRSGGEDGLYRVHLANGAIVECTVVSRSAASAQRV